MRKCNLDTLESHLYDVIERLKENDIEGADPKDCITLETAKAINETAKNVIDIAKVKVLALGVLAKADNPDATKSVIDNAGLLGEQ